MFIELILSAIKALLTETISTSEGMSDRKMDKAAIYWEQIENFLNGHKFIMNADISMICGVSSATTTG